MTIFDTYPADLEVKDLIQINTKEKFGQPDDRGRQLYKYNINFYYNGEKKAQDVYSYDECNIGDYHLPAMRPRILYVQELDSQKNKVVRRKPVILITIGRYIHS